MSDLIDRPRAKLEGTFLYWVFRGLGLREPVAPNELHERLQLTVDGLQGGFGGAIPIEELVPQVATGPLAADTIQLIANTGAQANSGALVLGYDALMTGAGNSDVEFSIRNPVLAVATILGRQNVSAVVTRGVRSYADFNGSTKPIYVPPGKNLQVRHNGVGAGDVLTINGLFLRIPSGVAPHW